MQNENAVNVEKKEGEELPAVAADVHVPVQSDLNRFFWNDADDDDMAAQLDQSSVEGELKAWLSAPPAKKQRCPLSWWREHESEFRRISFLAAKYLAVPASTASSERVFNLCKKSVKCRPRLMPDRLERWLFLKSNIQF